MGRWVRRLWPLLTVSLLLVGVAILSMIAKPGVHLGAARIRQGELPGGRAAATPDVPTPSGSATVPPRAVVSHLPAWVTDLAFYGCIALLLVCVAGLAWVLISPMVGERRAGHPEPLGEITRLNRRDAVLAAVDASIAELASEGGDARAAVIACWVRLEEVAAAAGTARAPGDTSSELVARLLADHQISAGVLMELADLYRTARYSTAPVDSSTRARARAGLARLRDELAHSRSGPLAEAGR